MSRIEIKDGKATITNRCMKELRKLDHSQLQKVLNGVYEKGKETARPDEALAVEVAEESITQLKGIGQSRKELFMETYKTNFRARTSNY